MSAGISGMISTNPFATGPRGFVGSYPSFPIEMQFQPQQPYPNYAYEQTRLQQQQQQQYQPVPKQYLPEMSIQQFQPGNVVSMSNPYIKQRGVTAIASYDNYPQMHQQLQQQLQLQAAQQQAAAGGNVLAEDYNPTYNQPLPPQFQGVAPQPQQFQVVRQQPSPPVEVNTSYQSVADAAYTAGMNAGLVAGHRAAAQEVYRFPAPGALNFVPTKMKAAAPVEVVETPAEAPVPTLAPVVVPPVAAAVPVAVAVPEAAVVAKPVGGKCSLSSLVGDSPRTFWGLIGVNVGLLCLVILFLVLWRSSPRCLTVVPTA